MVSRNSILAYGGSIGGSYISELYHIVKPDVLPGAVRINLVKNIKYFENNVSISSCEEAVSFVILLTTPMLRKPMDDHLGYEVFIKEDFTADNWLGQELFLPSYYSRYCAVVSKADAERMNILSAVCTKSGTYKISRYIFQSDEKGFIKMKFGIDANLILLEEEVTPNGQYRLIKKTIDKYNVNSVGWGFPIEY